MKLKRLRKKILRQARRESRAGRISKLDFYRCQLVADNDAALQKLNERIESEVNPWNQPGGLVAMGREGWFANIWDWFVANWPKILSIILTIAPLLLMEPDHEDS